MEDYAIEINHGRNGYFWTERQHFWEFFFAHQTQKRVKNP